MRRSTKITTILTDGNQVASDSQSSIGNERCPGECTKIIVENDILFAFSGTVCMFAPAIKWYKAGRSETDRPKAEAEGNPHTLWVFDPDRGAQCFNNVHRNPYPEPLDFPAALGSGSKYALGAFHAGASLEDAVTIAIALDVFSGGEVKVIDIPEKTTPIVKKTLWERVTYVVRGH